MVRNSIPGLLTFCDFLRLSTTLYDLISTADTRRAWTHSPALRSTRSSIPSLSHDYDFFSASDAGRAYTAHSSAGTIRSRSSIPRLSYDYDFSSASDAGRAFTAHSCAGNTFTQPIPSGLFYDNIPSSLFYDTPCHFSYLLCLMPTFLSPTPYSLCPMAYATFLLCLPLCHFIRK
ncbi:hypothetical protein BDR04DRAFT_657565 [Suillus decipiens]|nr:hypothetical protein BDR04DRAFT_657565 [Suillus decipiens]